MTMVICLFLLFWVLVWFCMASALQCDFNGFTIHMARYFGTQNFLLADRWTWSLSGSYLHRKQPSTNLPGEVRQCPSTAKKCNWNMAAFMTSWLTWLEQGEIQWQALSNSSRAAAQSLYSVGALIPKEFTEFGVGGLLAKQRNWWVLGVLTLERTALKIGLRDCRNYERWNRKTVRLGSTTTEFDQVSQ